MTQSKRSIKTNARVTRIIDGDTIEVALKIRLDRIDAPETKGIEKQSGLITKEYLTERLSGKDVRLEIRSNDVYYRLLSEVVDGEGNVGDDLLALRLAEVYTPEHHNNGKLDVDEGAE
ncbi:thermonuclease family protein [Priestia megaterium]|uniref:thermonuclease family protein n=1 Tax=Priestia megaterium TaxID=1404 RepID=UPI0039F67D0E